MTQKQEIKLNYVVKKIFEMSNLILRLERTLEEIRKNET